MTATFLCGNALETLRSLPDQYVQTCVTSPPYWGLRDYGTAKWEGGDADCKHTKKIQPQNARPLGSFHSGSDATNNSREKTYANICGKCGAVRVDDQLGLESTPDAYVARLVGIFREVRRVLADEGTLWLNLGDSYSSTTSTTGGYSEKSTLAGFTGEHTKGRQNHGGESRRLEPQCKPKNLVGIPWLVAFALRADGWYLRSDIIWAKPNPMPESVRDRPTRSHEYIFLLSKSARYYYDHEAIKEPLAEASVKRLAQASFDQQTGAPKDYGPASSRSARKTLVNLKQRHMCPQLETGGTGTGGRNKRDVWTVATQPYHAAHFATFPPELIRPCILAGSRPGDLVLDPFGGAGTTALVCEQEGRHSLSIELNPAYVTLAEGRLRDATAKSKDVHPPITPAPHWF